MNTEPGDNRQFVRYAFYRVRPEWRARPDAERRMDRGELAGIVEDFARRVPVLRTYSTVGMRADCDLLIWCVSYQLEDFRALQTAINRCRLGPYLELPHSYLAMTRRSVYVADHRHEAQEGRRLTVQPGGARYLFVYPFWKTRPWYQLPLEERTAMMRDHIRVGHKYPSVKINTSYSFGLDDPEFVVAFEGDVPADFLDLVMELRESAASSYTLRDTPIFTCERMSIGDALEAIG
ncbi:MAG: chlorite dismutase family protein [Chloroflexi bacterium]|nr:chlorite dismutase family protein [Chloroflexota bacterium]